MDNPFPITIKRNTLSPPEREREMGGGGERCLIKR